MLYSPPRHACLNKKIAPLYFYTFANPDLGVTLIYLARVFPILRNLFLTFSCCVGKFGVKNHFYVVVQGRMKILLGRYL